MWIRGAPYAAGVGLATVTLLFGLAGCGGSGPATPTFTPLPLPISTPTPSPLPPPAPAPTSDTSTEADCQPIEATGVLAPDVDFCASPDGYSAQLTNVSRLVLTIRSVGQGPVAMRDASPSTPSPEDAAARAAISTGPQADGSYTLPAGATVSVLSESQPPFPVRLNVEVAPVATLQANMARAAEAWIASKFTSPEAGLLQKTRSCVSSAGSVAQSNQRQSDAIRSAIGLGSCVDLLDLVRDDAGETVSEDSLANELLSFAKKAAGGSFDDELAGAVELIAHR